MPENNHEIKSLVLGVVGPCSAGKSTLIDRLQEKGYQCRHIAQEHSYVPDMWFKLVNPRLLIYLDVTYSVSMQRKKLNMNENEFEQQKERLLHAHQNADLYIQTDNLSPDEVFQITLEHLEEKKIHPKR